MGCCQSQHDGTHPSGNPSLSATSSAAPSRNEVEVRRQYAHSTDSSVASLPTHDLAVQDALTFDRKAISRMYSYSLEDSYQKYDTSDVSEGRGRQRGSRTPSDSSAGVVCELVTFCQNVGVLIEWDRNVIVGQMRGKYCSASAIQRFAPYLLAELKLYPPLFFTQQHPLKKIVVLEDLKLSGVPVGGCALAAEAVLYVNGNMIFVHADEVNRRWVLKVAFHHELFHLVDWITKRSFEDPLWEKLNPPGFCYGSGANSAERTNMDMKLNKDTRGFLTPYCKTNVTEDKANIFGYMIADWKRLEKKILIDSILKEKVTNMKQLCVEFCSAMDDGWWMRDDVVSWRSRSIVIDTLPPPAAPTAIVNATDTGA